MKALSRRIARPVAAAAALLAVAALAIVAARALFVPVGRLDVATTFRHVELADVRERALPHLRSGWLGTDLDELASSVQGLPWVREVSARRVWPDAVRLRIVERRAVAVWRGEALMAADGETFAEPTEAHAGLPRLAGAHGRAREVLRAYRASRTKLADHSVQLVALRRNERGGWRGTLGSGVELRLGRERLQRVLADFTEAGLPALRDRLSELAYVDLRYTNGFAVAERGEGQRGETGSTTEGG